MPQPMVNKPYIPDGPIPGENYTSNTKNYPWHRPPEITDMDKAIETIMKQLSTRNTSYSLLTVLQSGVPVVTAADIFLTNGIGAGKWTPDTAILLAGPTAHIMKLMAQEYGIKYDMGLDDEKPPMMPFVQSKSEIDPTKARNVVEDVAGQLDMIKGKADDIASKGGFMGGQTPPTPDQGQSQPQEEQGETAPDNETQEPPSNGFMG